MDIWNRIISTKEHCLKCSELAILNYNQLCTRCDPFNKPCRLCGDYNYLKYDMCILCNLFGAKKYCNKCKKIQYFTKEGICLDM
jgi:hypothetical protein